MLSFAVEDGPGCVEAGDVAVAEGAQQGQAPEQEGSQSSPRRSLVQSIFGGGSTGNA